jgi:hypothetical protein
MGAGRCGLQFPQCGGQPRSVFALIGLAALAAPFIIQAAVADPAWGSVPEWYSGVGATRDLRRRARGRLFPVERAGQLFLSGWTVRQPVRTPAASADQVTLVSEVWKECNGVYFS